MISEIIKSGIINFAQPAIGGAFNGLLVKIIIWLVQVSSSIAAGIIIFTLILKLITLPFDFVSRASMRKNSLKMEQMRPELERLQKQYADNKELYNQKMMALYKKNGYSMFGACLPTILTLIIFIVAINAFTDYSQYQNKLDFYHMSQSYNNVLYYGIEDDGEYILRNEDGSVIINSEKLYEKVKNNKNETISFSSNEVSIIAKWEEKIINEISYNKFIVETSNSYTVLEQNFDIINGVPKYGFYNFKVSSIKFDGENSLLASEYNNGLINSENKNFKDAYAAEVQRINKLNEENTQTDGWVELEVPSELKYMDEFINDIQSFKAAETYRKEKSSFLWIKNIWVTDSPTKHPIEKNWSTFKQTHEYSKKGEDIGQDNYALLIKHLEKEQNEPNGYFILVFLTAGLSLLSQIVMSKSQKAQMELQTVDGQGAQTQKMMTWMMPIMMAIFAFMYTSAFSIYIILSTLISMLSTFAINFIVDRKFKKENEQQDTGVVRGRIYIPKEEEKEEKTKKEKNVPKTGDFLSGTADGKKHVRGRTK